MYLFLSFLFITFIVKYTIAPHDLEFNGFPRKNIKNILIYWFILNQINVFLIIIKYNDYICLIPINEKPWSQVIQLGNGYILFVCALCTIKKNVKTSENYTIENTCF